MGAADNQAGDQPTLEDALGHYQQGRSAEARAACAALLRNAPGNADALHLLGLLTFQGGDAKAGAALMAQAIAVRPADAMAHSNLAAALNALGDHAAALAAAERALGLRPGFAGAGNNRGNALRGLGRTTEALESYAAAIAANHGLADAHNNLAIALCDLERHDEALESAETAVGLRPDFAKAHGTRAVILAALDRLEDAAAAYARVLVHEPDNTEAHIGRGTLLLQLGRPAAARTAFASVVAGEPGNGEARMNLGITQLQLGELPQGWENYEARWHNPRLTISQRNFTHPQWRGEDDLNGRTILLHNEQGLGDALHFCRYVPMVAGRGARVILEVQRSLVPLLARIEGVTEIVARGEALPPFDLQCPLLSLPLAFKTEMSSIPAPGRYIAADASKIAQWQNRLGPAARPRVGLTWSGNINQADDARRSIPLKDFVRALPGGLDYVSLQKEVRTDDISVLRERGDILHLADEIADFSDTAAICELTDLVVTVCTSTAHLAGALGKPTWVLLSFNPCWRWLTERSDSPWYPTTTLYRQSNRDAWDDVLDRVRADLGARL
jgi:tetratricopeptide (TPR) repeat protein